MKRFLCFASEDYAEQGGWNDLVHTADTVDEATAWLRDRMSPGSYDWWDVIDVTTGELVANWRRPLEGRFAT